MMDTHYQETNNLNVKSDINHIKFSVIIPVYNEEEGVQTVIMQLKKILTNLNENYEIITVDDGSTDNSQNILKNIDDIIYIRHARNIGYGGALKTGIKNARGEIIVITDGDGTYPNSAIPELLKEMDKYEMVVGERSKDDPNMPIVRKPAKWVLTKLANYLAEAKIPDLNSGLRAFRKKEALHFIKILPSGFSFTTTITLAMLCNKLKVKYIPIEYRKRKGKSKIHPIKDTINFLQLICRTVMYFNPLKIFLPISLFIFILFSISSAIDIIVLKNLTDKTVLLFLAFIQILAMGLLADLIEKKTP
jgi:glycosyltransferase involved in cell wall biosynthesis